MYTVAPLRRGSGGEVKIIHVPEPQRELLKQILANLKTDQPLLGVAIASSYLTGEMDEYSDLDLIIVADDVHFQQVLQERQILASNLGKLLQSVAVAPLAT
ncbi:MAG: nucleotidyltransferase domain-containing protein [Nostoc sp. DedQUE12a]|nr:nucleotidyltransferase domain-containing protein [Nostoc sp. DedQUE12a]